MNRRFHMIWGLVMGCAFAAAAEQSAMHPRPLSQAVDRAAAGWPVGPFALVDQHGEPFTHVRLAGRWTFLLLGDTRCGAPCADALAALAGLYQRIAKTRAVTTTQVVFVSLASQDDTPARLRTYLKPFDPRFLAATGPEPVLARLADDLGVAPGVARYTGSLWLIGPDGVIRGRMQPPYDVPLLTSEYLRTRARG
jgi:protein SCO1/2